MIARELLVKLGSNIDEKKLDRFSNNVQKMKSQVEDLRAKVHSSIKPTLEVGTFIAQKNKIEKQLQKDTALPQKSGGNLSAIKAQMQELQQKIALGVEPNSNVDQLIAYKKELQKLSSKERKEIEELNKQEKMRAKADTSRNRQKLRQLTAIKAKLKETNSEFKRAARAANRANQTFSRFFSRFAFATIGSIGLNIRSTIKDAKEFKGGAVNKASGGFTKDQINSVDRFNSTLMQTRRITSGIRNNLVTELLPSIKEYLDLLNSWLLANKELIKQKFKDFMSSLAKSFKSMFGVFKSFYNVLDPLVQLIGGWSTILTGFIGAGILSWVVRLGVFLGRAGKAVLFAAGAIKTFSIALYTNPLALLIIGIGAALALLVDEIYVTIKGGDSLINRFAPLRTAFDVTRIVIEGFVDGLKEAWSWIEKLNDIMEDFSPIPTFSKLKKTFQNLPEIKLPFSISKPEILDKIDGLDSKLNVYKVKGGAGKTFRDIEPSSIASSVSNKNTRNVVNNRNNINLSVNLKEGTTEKQAREITTLVEEKLRENNVQNNLEELNAIGM